MDLATASPDTLLTSAEVAAVFNVCLATLDRWAKKHKIPFSLTPGGRRRYRLGDLPAEFLEAAMNQDVLMSPEEVADLFRVCAKTVTRWSKEGKLTAVMTLGGHRRFRSSQVRSLMAAA